MYSQDYLDSAYAGLIGVCERYSKTSNSTWTGDLKIFFLFLGEKFPKLQICDACSLIEKLIDDGFVKSEV